MEGKREWVWVLTPVDLLASHQTEETWEQGPDSAQHSWPSLQVTQTQHKADQEQGSRSWALLAKARWEKIGIGLQQAGVLQTQVERTQSYLSLGLTQSHLSLVRIH